ncbi:DUF4097 family beta strand repeat-containing protein [Anaerovorax odorimutans]|uniref:DUF4097 family beta strand repeat-containing protein n=1 Tax=Anaerovorax odorimutans TaxID=109327 RepID=UPI000427CD76|nr:DUF4097 family beta strand repeat-containing protein [Anaerovorax odorimutans]
MKKATKKIVLIAIILIVIGIIFALIGSLTGGMRSVTFGKNGISIGPKLGENSSENLVTDKYDFEKFINVKVDADLYKIEFVRGNEYAVEFSYDENYEKPNIYLKDDTLIINDEENNFSFLGFNRIGIFSQNSKPRIKIYYPETTKFNNVEIENSGELVIKDLIAKQIDLNIDLGSADISDIETDNLEIEIDGGKCNINNVEAGKSNISLDLGELSTRDFKTKGLKVDNRNGEINLHGTFEGKNNIECDLGSINIDTSLKEEDCSYSIDVDLGSVKINGKAVDSTIVNNTSSNNSIKAEISGGEVNINFAK